MLFSAKMFYSAQKRVIRNENKLSDAKKWYPTSVSVFLVHKYFLGLLTSWILNVQGIKIPYRYFKMFHILSFNIWETGSDELKNLFIINIIPSNNRVL